MRDTIGRLIVLTTAMPDIESGTIGIVVNQYNHEDFAVFLGGRRMILWHPHEFKFVDNP